MSRYLRSLVSKHSNHLPRNLLYSFYTSLFSVFRKLTGLSPDQIWVRNSLALDYWEFGQSDLDISILVPGGSREAYKIYRRIKPLRKLLLGGEIQIYTTESLKRFTEYSNVFEVNRDPILFELTKHLITNNHLDLKKNIFLLKLFASDKSLFDSPDLRQRKWKHHLDLVGYHLDKISAESLAKLLAENYPFNEVLSDLDILKAIRHSFHNFNIHNLSRTNKILFPNRYVWINQNDTDDILDLESLTDETHRYLGLMVEWEIWGLSSLTHITSGFPLKNLFDHVENQIRLVECLRIATTEKERLVSGLRNLAEYYEDLKTVIL